MERKEIFQKLTAIFCEVMSNDDIVLEDSTTADDIEEWDSLAHVQLMENIEQEFGVRISAKDMASWIDVGEMVDFIEKKTGK